MYTRAYYPKEDKINVPENYDGNAFREESVKTDIEEAEQIGVMAVERALKGESGKVMYFKRVSNSPYTVVIDSIDANEIANKVKYFPLGWINSSGNNVTDEAVDYILPLIQGEQDIHYLNGMPIHFKLGN